MVEQFVSLTGTVFVITAFKCCNSHLKTINKTIIVNTKSWTSMIGFYDTVRSGKYFSREKSGIALSFKLHTHFSGMQTFLKHHFSPSIIENLLKYSDMIRSSISLQSPVNELWHFSCLKDTTAE